jgi:hypothetical protein
MSRKTMSRKIIKGVAGDCGVAVVRAGEMRVRGRPAPIRARDQRRRWRIKKYTRMSLPPSPEGGLRRTGRFARPTVRGHVHIDTTAIRSRYSDRDSHKLGVLRA